MHEEEKEHADNVCNEQLMLVSLEPEERPAVRFPPALWSRKPCCHINTLNSSPLRIAGSERFLVQSVGRE